MGVRVNFHNQDTSDEYDDATGWTLTVSDAWNTLTVYRDNTEVASYANWSSVVRIPKKDSQAQLEEAIELVSLVDGGKFTNQDSDWKERAQELLGE